MAIIVAGEKQKSPLAAILTILAIVIILVIGAYYLFFSPAPAIEKVIVPQDLQSISQVSKVSIDTQAITESATYKTLVPKLPALQVSGYGRANPFILF
jgi:hypothetical protein